MCGLNGVLVFKPGTIAAQIPFINKLTAMAKRRGPDDEGMWTDTRHCAFGFRRLSILDLTPAGKQPMQTPDERYTIVFNGEIYNFKEIRHELETQGIRFRSSGDTEVILWALSIWGKKALDKLNGMFAFAFYDSKERKLLIARDHSGIKPIYYLINSEGLLFASQYDQILAHPWASKEKISQEALGLYLRFVHIPPPFAFLKNTFLLEPGAWMEIDSESNIKQGKYFEFPKYRKPDLFGEEAYEAVDSALSNAIKRQLVSDVPVGAFLSGGIDSPLVAAKAKETGVLSLKAFTIGTNNDEFDESPDAVRYAEEIGIDQTIKHFTPDQAFSMFDEVVEACGEPFSDYSIFPTMLVARLARENGFKVMLSGDGGDELFWGYAERFGSILKRAEDFKRPYWQRSARWGFKKYLGLGSGYSNLRQKSIGDWYRKKHSRFSEEMLTELFPDKPEYPVTFSAYKYKGGDKDECAQWLRWNEYNYHLGMVLMKVDRASMYHSVEVRVPILDREVIDIASRVDWKSCLELKNNEGKIPLRKSLNKYSSFQTKGKRGFNVPMAEWLRGPLKNIFMEKFSNITSLCGIPINRSSVQKIFKKHCEGKIDAAGGLWMLLSLRLWEEKHYQHK